MSLSIQQPKLLVVEGRDEQLCLEAALRDHLGLSDIQVMPIGGKTLLTWPWDSEAFDDLWAFLRSM
jgi:hypothetical protein